MDTFKRKIQILSLLLCLHVVQARRGDRVEGSENNFILRNPKTQLVIDASEDFVTLQPYTGFSSQQWRLQPSKIGAYYVINRASGKLLDIDYRYPVSNSWVVVGNRIGGIPVNNYINGNGNSNGNGNGKNNTATDTKVKIDACQQWFFHYDGSIVNVCGKFALDIKGGQAGVYLETLGANGSDNQKFKFQYV